MMQISIFNGNTTIYETAKITFTECAVRCKDECAVFVKYNALNSNLWMIFASMIICTLFYYLNKNEEGIRQVALMTKQTDTRHVQDTLNWVLFAGIGLMILYITLFLWQMQNIRPMG